MKNTAKSIIPVHQTTNQIETDGLFAGGRSIPCTMAKCSCDMEVAMLSVSASKNEGVDILRFISVYILNIDGIVNGIINLKSTSSKFMLSTSFQICDNLL